MFPFLLAFVIIPRWESWNLIRARWPLYHLGELIKQNTITKVTPPTADPCTN